MNMFEHAAAGKKFFLVMKRSQRGRDMDLVGTAGTTLKDAIGYAKGWLENEPEDGPYFVVEAKALRTLHAVVRAPTIHLKDLYHVTNE